MKSAVWGPSVPPRLLRWTRRGRRRMRWTIEELLAAAERENAPAPTLQALREERLRWLEKPPAAWRRSPPPAIGELWSPTE